MTDGPELFPVAIGHYSDNHPELNVDRELAKVSSTLEPFSVRVHDWDVPMPERGLNNVRKRINAWRNAVHPATILYWVGHGSTDNANTAVLYHADSEPDLPDDGVAPYVIAKAIASRLCEDDTWAIIVIDACGSQKFIDLLQAQLLVQEKVAGRYLLVGGLSGEGSSTLGTFSSSLDSLLNTTFAGEFLIELSKLADEFDRREARVERSRLVDRDPRRVPVLRRRHAVLINSSVDVIHELEQALRGLSDDELRHFLPKAHGGELPFTETVLGEQSWYFEGRTTETHRIIDWLKTAEPGMLVVTGAPGSGKSALLGHLVVHSNPSLRTALTKAGVLVEVPDDQRPPDAIFDLVLHLTGTTPEEVLARIAEGIGAGQPPTGSVHESTSWLRDQLGKRPLTTIVIDALDEAVEPLTVARVILRSLAEQPNVRLLVGTRSSTTEGPDHPATDVDLLDALGHLTGLISVDRDDDAIERYIIRRLHRANKAAPSTLDIAAFARAVRARRRQFLFARLAVHEVLADKRWHLPANWDALLGHDHQHVFSVAVERLANKHRSHLPLLRALAFARGRGVPDQGGLWVVLARALAPDHDIHDDDVERLVRDAAPYVLADREYGQTVYRLAHRTFAELFTTESAPTPADHQAHLAITTALVNVASPKLAEVIDGVTSLNPYLTYQVSAHAGIAGETGWDVLDDNRDVLLALDSETVARDIQRYAFARLPLPPAMSTVLSAWHDLQPLELRDRGLAFQMALGRIMGGTAHGTGGLRENYPTQLQWAALRNVTPHRVLAHTSDVYAVSAVAFPDGRILLATGSSDDTVRLWDPVTGHPHGTPLTGHTDRVSAVAAVVLPDGRTLLASGSNDRTVRLWDPVTSHPHGAPMTGHTDWVTAVTAVALPDGRTLLATSSRDGTVRLWDPVTSHPHGAPMTGHTDWVTAVTAVA
ncbi:AAA family ATPase, partial [Nocardia sp. NPDC058705]|uniref:AAA family ATPase n=1 Tax=Nocardia sp. NPDC058705 TaxID=3346609 RepID=UPI0036B81EDC